MKYASKKLEVGIKSVSYESLGSHTSELCFCNRLTDGSKMR